MLLTSDLHYRLPQYDWVLRAAARFDAVAIAGDHVDASATVPARAGLALLGRAHATVRLRLASRQQVHRQAGAGGDGQRGGAEIFEIHFQGMRGHGRA